MKNLIKLYIQTKTCKNNNKNSQKKNTNTN